MSAGTNHHPPMLEMDHYDLRCIRLKRHIKQRLSGKLIWKSVKEGKASKPRIDETVEG